MAPMNSDALVLRDDTDSIWREFASRVHDATSSPALDSPSSLVRAEPALLPRWRRALSLGASLDGPPPEEHLLRGDALKEHVDRAEPVLHLAAADLERTASDVSPREYVTLVADAAGVVVNVIGGGHFADVARRVRLIPGANWSEAVRGTNGIGTAIAEQRPVYVHGSAHLGRRFHDLVCYAAPIFDADGSLLAVLNASSMFSCADDTIGAAVVRTAGAVMRALRDRAFGQAGAAVQQTLSRALERMEGVALLIEPPGRIARMNAGARLLFGQRGEANSRALLGADMSVLSREARDPQGLVIERGGRRFAVRVDPIQTFDGRQIALLVFLEPLRQKRLAAASAPQPSAAFARVFSRDPQLDDALSLARRIADSSLPVLLIAESGAGQKLVARAIHDASSRASQPFVAVNCGAIAPSQLENELFGEQAASSHSAGRQGLLAKAIGGTLFLDELEAMTPPSQAALLRVLEEGTLRRSGDLASQPAELRLLSGTNRDLKTLVEAGTFRRDLYYCLKGAEIRLPPLRARTDRSALAAHLLVALARKRGVLPAPRLSADVLAAIERYTWPGNVRELQNLLDVSLILAQGSPSIELEHLPPEFRRALEQSAYDVRTQQLPLLAGTVELAALEAAAVRRVLSDVGGNVSLAAKRLGVARSTLYRMMRRHDL